MIYGVHVLAPDASPGQRLRYARQAMRLTQEDVSRLLRLQMNIIQALEEDDYEKVPAPLFVRGYLRAYARLVKVAEEEVIACYNNLSGVIKELPTQAAQHPNALNQPQAKRWLYAKWWLGIGILCLLITTSVLFCLFWL